MIKRSRLIVWIVLGLSGALFIGSRFGAFGEKLKVETSNFAGMRDKGLDSSKSKTNFINWHYCLVQKSFSDGEFGKVLRADGSQTNDCFDVSYGNLYGDKGGVEYFLCGEQCQLGKTEPDRNVHVKLFTAKENSAFDESVKNLYVRVVRDEDGQVVFKCPCELEAIDDNIFLDQGSEAFRNHLNSKNSDGNRCICCDEAAKATKLVKDNCSKKLKLKLPEHEVQNGVKSDGIYVGNFMNQEDLELLNRGELDGRKFDKSNGKVYTFEFFTGEVDDGSGVLLAKVKHKFDFK